jgi:acyl-[acyl carrier protein]--UDP-N-acetylglucosamine O-acyltransferase
MNRLVGLFVVVGGICLIGVGLLIYSGGFNWFGRLPGDIRYEGERAQVYIPIVSMLVVSAALSLIFYLIRRFF